MNSGEFYEFLAGVSARVDEVTVSTKDLTPKFMGAGLFKEVMADDVAYNTKGTTGLGRVERFTEDGAIKEDKTYPMYGTQYIPQDYGKIVTISQKLAKVRPAIVEEKIGEVKSVRIAMNKTLDTYAWQVLKNGFSTTNAEADYPVFRLDDAVALYSASHPSKVPGVAVRSNLIVSNGVTNPALSETALFDGIKMLREMKDGRGLPIRYEGKVLLIVPTALEKLALEITKSQRRAGTANNDLNYFEGTVDVLSVVELGAGQGGSDTAWYLVGVEEQENAPFRYVKLIDPKIEQEKDFNTKALKVSIDGSFCFGYSNFEYTVASSGLLS